MDEHWQHWQSEVLTPLLEYDPGKEQPAALKKLLAQDPGQVDLALVAADTDRTQAYIFECSKLPEIRGGSELLQELNQGLRDIVTGHGLPGECVLYAAGGGFLALAPDSLAASLADEMRRSYPAKTGVATITCVSRRVSPAQVLFGYGGKAGQSAAGFGQMRQLMDNLIRREKEGPPVRPVVEALPFAMRCKLCQVRPAEKVYTYFDEPWPVCDACRRKVPPGERRKARSTPVDRFLTWLAEPDHGGLQARYLDGTDLDQVHFAQDVEELGKACLARSNYVGMIYADGNRIGRILESLPTPSAYREFSKALKTALTTAVYQAMAENLHPTGIERVSPTGKPLGWGHIHPLEPLIAGGDDVVLLLPADAALPVAVRTCQLFEQYMAECKLAIQPPPTLSAGVVIADSHNPVRVLLQIAKDLCKSAKQRACLEKHTTSTLDWLAVKSQSMLRQRVKDLRKMQPYYYEEGDGGGRIMTAAPYTLAESRRLLEMLKLLRQLDLATSQLQSLVAALHEGRLSGSVFYLYQMARLAARLGEGRRDQNALLRLTEIWPYHPEDSAPWHRAPGKKEGAYASVVPDLLELFPFVPRPAGEEQEQRAEMARLWQEILTEAPHV